MAALVFNTVKTPDGRPVKAKVEVRLIAGPTLDEPGWLHSDRVEILSVWASQTDDSGYWAVELEPNGNIEPSGTYYKVTERYPPGNRATTYYIQIPDAATSQFWVGDILVIDPQAIENPLDAATITFTPTGTLVSTNVQDAIVEAADKSFVYEQLTPSDEWTIPHGLGKSPAVTIQDTAGTEVEGEVHHVDNNTVKVVFSVEFSGKATCN